MRHCNLCNSNGLALVPLNVYLHDRHVLRYWRYGVKRNDGDRHSVRRVIFDDLPYDAIAVVLKRRM